MAMKSLFACGRKEYNMKKNLCLVVIIVMVCMMLAGCSSSGSYRSNGYSSTYNNNSSYRNNVNDVANIYGEDPQHVDAVLNALTGGK